MTIPNFPHPARLPFWFLLAAVGNPSRAASLYSESFDSQATAKVVVNKLANADLAFVDYSSFVRDQPGGGGPVTIRIPEAPNRIPGSAPTRGVLLNATYGGTARTINLLASATPGGAATIFSGDYRLRFDMWLAVDPSATAGTTEVGLFGVGHSGTATVSYARRSSGIGTFGWISAEGGIGAGNPAGTNGDNGLFVGTVPAFFTENLNNAGLYATAFPQGTSLSNTPNNQWTQVELWVVGTKATLYMNGVKFGETTDPAITTGFASIGYEDPFTGSTPGGFNRQFGLFDNLTVESLTGPARLEAGVGTVFPRVEAPLQTTTGDFVISNFSLDTSYSITSATIDGAHAGDFTLTTLFPLPVAPQTQAVVSVNFDPATPNGLKVARLRLATTDPNLPEIVLPLQARRAINTLEATLSSRIASVSAVNGTGSGAITISNGGETEVSVSAPVVSGADAAMFAVAASFPVVIAAGDAATLPVNFTPTGAPGRKSASFEFTTTDPGVPTLTVNGSARYAFGPPLLAHYKMDETSGTALVDSAAASPNARLEIREQPFGFGEPSLLPGGAGTAIRLTPADSSAIGNFAISTAVHLPNVSYSLWIKPEAKPAGNRRILHRSSLFTLTGTLYSLYLTPAGKLVFEVNSQTAAESEEGAVIDDTVYHVAVTHRDEDGFGNSTGTPTATRTRLFINGEKVGESVEPVGGFTDYTLTTTSEGLYIGTATSAGQGYLGLVDDLQIYSAELSEEEIYGLFSQPGKTAAQLEAQDYRITGVEYNSGTGQITLTWNSAPGAVYSVQQSTTTSGFVDVPQQTGIAADGVRTSVTFVAPAGPRRFFQIRRTSP